MNLTALFHYIKLIFNKYLYYNKLYIKYYLILQLKIIWIFTETFFGYAFYLFCTLYGVSGLSSEKNEVLKAWCIIFVIYVAGSVVQWYILVKIPSTKKLLENFIGKDFIISHLGQYTASKALVKIAATVGPFVGIAAAEVVTKQQNLSENMRKSDYHIKTGVENYKQAGLDVDKKFMDKLLNDSKTIANQPTKGIVTKAIDGDTITKVSDSLSKIFGKK